MKPARRKRAREHPAREDRQRVGWRWLLAVFVAALAYRAVCFAVMGADPLFRRPVVDAGYHDAWARRIAAGDTLGHGPDDVFKPPLYATFLAGLYALFGRHIGLVQWVQHAMGAASCVLIAMLAGRLLGRTAGRVAGLLAALYAPFVFFEAQLLTPALSVFLNLAALVLLVSPGRLPGRRRLAGCGLLLGLSVGMRPDVVVPAALVVGYLLVRAWRATRRQRATAALWIAGGIACIVAPILVRNYHLVGQLIPVSSNAGINFYVGNAAGADGITAVPVGLRWERLVSRVPQEVLERPAMASRWWMGAAWAEMAAAPGAALCRLGAKASAFVNRREFRNNVCFHFMARRSWPLLLSPVQFAVVVPLAVCGLFGLWRRGGHAERRAFAVCALWVLGYWVVGAVFFVTARFRLPAVPLLLLPASWCIAQAVAAARARQGRRLAADAAVLCIAGALCWPPWLGSPREGWVRDHVNLGNSLREAKDAAGARRAYRDALALAPDDPDAHYLLGMMLLPSRRTEALEHLEAARAALPDSPDLLLAIAEGHAAAGSKAAARQALAELLALAETSNLLPKRATWAKAHLLLARLDPQAAAAHWERAWAIHAQTAAEAAFLGRRELPRALETFEAEARDRPWDWYAQANYGWCLLEMGRAAEAVGPLRRAARLAPERPGVRALLARALRAAGRRQP